MVIHCRELGEKYSSQDGVVKKKIINSGGILLIFVSQIIKIKQLQKLKGKSVPSVPNRPVRPPVVVGLFRAHGQPRGNGVGAGRPTRPHRAGPIESS